MIRFVEVRLMYWLIGVALIVVAVVIVIAYCREREGDYDRELGLDDDE